MGGVNRENEIALPEMLCMLGQLVLQFVPKFPHNPKTCTAHLSTKEAGLSIDFLRRSQILCPCARATFLSF